jgi:CDP-glucose 4,6-dehydratase
MWLRCLGADVWGYALPPETQPSLYDLAGVADDVNSEFGDIRDRGALASFLKSCQPHVVLHLAAQPIVRRSYADPAGTFETNVIGTVNVLEAVRQCSSVEAVVVVTSDKCYENRERAEPYAEGDALGGSDPYSASKACAELIAASYRSSFFADSRARIATARAGNVIGGGDWSADRIVPDIVSAATRGSDVVLRYPDAIRPWQHVLEPLYAYAKLAQSLARDGSFASGWNFGPTSQTSLTVAELAERCLAGWGMENRLRRSTDRHPPEHHALRLDSAKARERLGVRTVLSIDQTCDWTIDWYRRWHAGDDARTLCLEQIQRYQTLL